MEGAVIVNGKLIPAGQAAIGLDNRAFHYADGLFESIRVVHGKACFLDAHWTRLIEGMKVLRIEQPNGLDERSLIVFINRLIEENGLPNGRLRLTVFRDSPGYFRPHAHQGGFALELEPVSSPVFILNHEGLTVDLYPEMCKAVNKASAHCCEPPKRERSFRTPTCIARRLPQRGRGLPCLKRRSGRPTRRRNMEAEPDRRPKTGRRIRESFWGRTLRPSRSQPAS